MFIFLGDIEESETEAVWSDGDLNLASSNVQLFNSMIFLKIEKTINHKHLITELLQRLLLSLSRRI